MSTFDNLRKDATRWLKARRGGDADARARLLIARQAAAASWPSLIDSES